MWLWIGCVLNERCHVTGEGVLNRSEGVPRRVVYISAGFSSLAVIELSPFTRRVRRSSPLDTWTESQTFTLSAAAALPQFCSPSRSVTWGSSASLYCCKCLFSQGIFFFFFNPLKSLSFVADLAPLYAQWWEQFLNALMHLWCIALRITKVH